MDEKLKTPLSMQHYKLTVFRDRNEKTHHVDAKGFSAQHASPLTFEREYRDVLDIMRIASPSIPSGSEIFDEEYRDVFEINRMASTLKIKINKA